MKCLRESILILFLSLSVCSLSAHGSANFYQAEVIAQGLDHPWSIAFVSNDELLNLRELAQLFQDATSLKLNISWGAIPYRKREVMVPYNRGEKVPGWSMKHSLRRALKLLSL